MLGKARKDAGDIISKAADEARKKAADMMQKACSEAKSEADKIINAGVESSGTVKTNAEPHIEAATKIIIRQIIGDA